MLVLAREVIDQLDALAAGTVGAPFDPAAAAAILSWASVTGNTNVKPK